MNERSNEFITETDITIGKENANKLYRILLLVEVYAEDRKALKYLLKLAIGEKRYLKKLYFPLDEEISNKIESWIEDTVAVIKGLRNARSVSRYNKEKENLRVLMSNLQKELCFEARMTEGLRGVLQTAKEKIHSLKEDAMGKIGQAYDLWGKKGNDSKSE